MAKVKNKRENHNTKRSYGKSTYDERTTRSGKSGERTAAKGRSFGEKTGVKSRAGREKFTATGRDSYGHEDGPRNENIVIGRNPVTEALKNGREIDKLLISSQEGSMVKILAMAREKGIPVMKAEREALDRVSQGGIHQGVIAYTSPYKYSQMEDIFELAKERGEDPFVVILDGLEDPHNLGAIMRTAECAGAHGVIIPKRNACGLTDVVAKASAGAVEYLPCVKVTNIVQTIDELKEMGIWIAACDMGGNAYYEADMKGKISVVIGSEGFGISRLVKEKCDFVVSMPMRGKITSLNASNAAAVILYEVRKQRDGR